MEELRLPGPGFALKRSRYLREHLTWMRLCGRADRTIYSRRRSIVLLAEYLRSDPADAEYAALERWQVHLAGTSLELARWQTTLVRPYFRWLQQRGLRTDNPAALLPLPPGRRGVPRPMAESKVNLMIASARPRLRPWLLLAGWSGLRAVEVARLQVEDFQCGADGNAWVRVTGKGGGVRHAPIPEWAWPLIVEQLPESGLAWRRERGNGPVTALHVSQLCNRHLHALGISDTFHSLRHRVATLALEGSGGDLRMVQDLLGHKQLSTTAIYTLVEPTRMAVAVNGLPRPELPAAVRHHLRVVPQQARGRTS